MQLTLPLALDTRAAAMEYVRWLLSTGYDEIRAADELTYGHVAEPGFEIAQGRIFVPWHMCPERRSWKFSELAREVTQRSTTITSQT